MKIKELTLYSSNITVQKEFYTEILGLSLVTENENQFTVSIGKSLLTFEYHAAAKPSHFAINITSTKTNEALKWLQKRVEILPCEGENIADFKNWNAEAMYFYDNDKNIVEFIGRKDIEAKDILPFSVNDLLNISEMGIVSNDNEHIYDQINKIDFIPIYDGSFERFCAIGNEEGLFILVNKTKKKWYPTMEEAYTSDFKIKGDYNFTFLDGKIIAEK